MLYDKQQSKGTQLPGAAEYHRDCYKLTAFPAASLRQRAAAISFAAAKKGVAGVSSFRSTARHATEPSFNTPPPGVPRKRHAHQHHGGGADKLVSRHGAARALSGRKVGLRQAGTTTGHFECHKWSVRTRTSARFCPRTPASLAYLYSTHHHATHAVAPPYATT